MVQYANAIENFYFHPEQNLMNVKEVKDGITEIVKSYEFKEGFHHVLTEMAFLKIRWRQEKANHGIIPVVLNGQGIEELPYFRNDVFLRLVPKWEHATAIHETQIRHEFFIKLLRQTNENAFQEINEFQRCYVSCVEELRNPTVPQLDFDNFVQIQINSALKRVERNLQHNIRTGEFNILLSERWDYLQDLRCWPHL